MKTFDRLLAIARKLRSQTGCPWDRKQTIRSLTPKLEEETGEVLTAVRKHDYDNLEEELGDLLFNIVLLTQIASESGKFRMSGVLRKVEQKIIARHTWVFGSDKHKVKNAADALALWQENKIKLKKIKTLKSKK